MCADTYSHAPSLAEIAQLVEHVHGKDEVVGSIPTLGSEIRKTLPLDSPEGESERVWG